MLLHHLNQSLFALDELSLQKRDRVAHVLQLPLDHSDCASNLWISTGRTSPLISDDEARNQAQISAQNSLDLDLGNGTTPGDGEAGVPTDSL